MTVTEVTKDKIEAKPKIGKKSTWKLNRKKGGIPILLKSQVKKGDTIVENQIVASVVPVVYEIPKGKVNSSYFITNLSNLNHSERYAAAKALRFFNEPKVISALKKKITTNEEHIYVRLEAAASLAILGEVEGYEFIENSLKDEYLQNVLESVIVLNEIKSARACKLLCKILLDENFDAEIRAGAAWGLGEQQNKDALTAIVSSFNAVEESIRIEAARALAKLTKNYSNDILKKFTSATSNEKPGVAWALTKSNSLTLDRLFASIKDQDSKEWISYIIGTHGEEKYISEIEKIKTKDPEVYFAVTLLWKIMAAIKTKEY